MELHEAVAKANQILDEERSSPTVTYIPAPRNARSGTLEGITDAIDALTTSQRIRQNRSQRPREVFENPRLCSFESTNYTLLCALLLRVAKESRSAFLDSVLFRLGYASPCAYVGHLDARATWNGFVSELPLVAEFCIRNGGSQNFFNALGEANPTPGHAILLKHLEEMVALNFAVLNESEYQQLAFCVTNFRDNAARQLDRYRKAPQTQRQWAGRPVNLLGLLTEIKHAAKGILEQSRKACYFYLKGFLTEGLNLEINQDKDAVQTYLRALGLSETLAGSLEEAERLYRSGGNAFTLKASMGHLRSFLEGLHREALIILHKRFGGELSQRWGDGLSYLRQKEILSKSEEGFVASLYTLISDEGVHPLIAEREYARLFRNVLIEYALLLMRKIEKLGLKPVQ